MALHTWLRCMREKNRVYPYTKTRIIRLMLGRIRQFFEQRRHRKIQKAAKTVKNPKAIREDRAAAIEYLCSLDDCEIAVPALLQRFDFSLEHGIADTREKETSLEGIVRFGDKALPFVRDHLRATTRIAWPIKALHRLGSGEEVAAVLLGTLNAGDIAFDAALVDKNYDILCYLREHQLPDASKVIGHFLNDPDERVRFAAVEVLVEQKSDEGIAAILERFLGDASSENRRIRKVVAEAFLKNHWVVREQKTLGDFGGIMDGLVLGADRRLSRPTTGG